MKISIFVITPTQLTKFSLPGIRLLYHEFKINNQFLSFSLPVGGQVWQKRKKPYEKVYAIRFHQKLNSCLQLLVILRKLEDKVNREK